MFGDDWTFQKDSTRRRIHAKSQKWCANSFPSFISDDDWPPTSPDLNPLDSCIWKEIAQVIKWNTVISKKTLIIALKRALEEISKDVVLESC